MIPVYTISSESRICFDDTKFDLRDFKYEHKGKCPDHMHEECFEEYDTILNILRDFKNNCLSATECIIVKKDVYTLIPPKEFADYIATISSRQDYDVFYLSYYLDACNLHHVVDNINNVHINKIEEPYGFHAIILKASLVDMLLGVKPMKNGSYMEIKEDILDINMLLSVNIKEGNISAKNTYPPLMYYNLRKADKKEDYLKVDPCKSIIETTNNRYIKWIVLLILFILLLFVVVILFVIQRK